jgi:hypothetical protein
MTTGAMDIAWIRPTHFAEDIETRGGMSISMNANILRVLICAAVAAVCASATATDAEQVAGVFPHLRHRGAATQLVVDGRPFLMRGGEFANKVYESPQDLPYLEGMLDACKDADLNTVLVPISWRCLEPQEGTFDYLMIDHLIEQCQKRDLRVVILWFGAIKNGSVGYAPRWFTGDHQRFFRATQPDGKETGAISPFCEAAWRADRRAFVKLMERIKEEDAGHYTVVMIQPENETGCQQIDNDRDHCPAADTAWQSAVPEDLMTYLTSHDGSLVPWLQSVWERAGKKASGTWPEVFGAAANGQKVFMSYYIGQFVERVASAGKAVHPLPMFINDWLGSLESPGGPIGGPEYHVMDVFRVTTPSSFACVADIYQPNFKAWIAAFDRKDNPILIPEARFDARAAQQCWYTFLQHDGLLFSPYMMVPGEADQKAVPACLARSNLKMSYQVIKEMDQLILSKQGMRPRELLCFQLDQSDKPDAAFSAEFQGYAIRAQATRPYDHPRGSKKEPEEETPGFTAIAKMAADDFVIIGRAMQVNFGRSGVQVKAAQRGHFRANTWFDDAAFSVKLDADCATVLLTEADRSLDMIRLKLAVP